MALRKFKIADFLRPASGEPLRSVITQSDDAAVVAWCVLPGQMLSAHVHPSGQDTWTVLQGVGQYQTDAHGSTETIVAGDVVVAHRGQVHGVYNAGDVQLVIVSVVSPAESGFELIQPPTRS